MEQRLVDRRWALVVHRDNLSRHDICRQLEARGLTSLPTNAVEGANLAIALVGPILELVITDQSLSSIALHQIPSRAIVLNLLR